VRYGELVVVGAGKGGGWVRKAKVLVEGKVGEELERGRA